MRRETEITVSIHFVDGGFQELRKGSDFLVRLRSLQARGVEGKALINQLISDDWAAPPSAAVVSGIGPDGERIKIVIPYR